MKNIFLIFFLILSLFIFAEDKDKEKEPTPPVSVENLLGSISSDFEEEETEIASDYVNANIAAASTAMEILLNLKDKPSQTVSTAMQVAGPIIGSHRLGPAQTVTSWSKKYKAIGCAAQQVLVSAYEIVSQIDGSMNAADIIFIIVGQIIKEVLNEILEQMVNGILTALEVPPGIKEIIGTILSEIISFFLIDPAVDELVNFAQDLVH